MRALASGNISVTMSTLSTQVLSSKHYFPLNVTGDAGKIVIPVEARKVQNELGTLVVPLGRKCSTIDANP